MGLQDFASVFSRSFVVGFFVPAFLAVFALDQLGTETLMPETYRDASGGTQLLVLGGAGVVLGILLSGLNYPILRLFEGYPSMHTREGGLAHNLYVKRRRKWLNRFDALEDLLQGPQSRVRTNAAMELNAYFPARKTAFFRLASGMLSARSRRTQGSGTTSMESRSGRGSRCCWQTPSVRPSRI